jgi:hypothetical protein
MKGDTMNKLKVFGATVLAVSSIGVGAVAAPPHASAQPGDDHVMCGEWARKSRVAAGVGTLFDSLGNYDYASNYWELAQRYLSKARACYEDR